jgi:hypothetical protein
MQIQQLVPAESGWKALFEEPTEEITRSRILGWALVQTGKTVEVVGMIVDPLEPSQIIAAPGSSSPGGGAFSRYGFSAEG